jgi:MFS family permease
VTTAGRVWILSLLSLPLIGMLVGSAMVSDWTDDNWRWRSIAWVVLGAGVPLIAAIVHTRKLGIIIVTLLVGATTYPAIRRLAQGPTVIDTTIHSIDCQTRERHGTRCIEQRLTLDDGKQVVLDASDAKGLREGARARVTVLDDVALHVAPL